MNLSKELVFAPCMVLFSYERSGSATLMIEQVGMDIAFPLAQLEFGQ